MITDWRGRSTREPGPNVVTTWLCRRTLPSIAMTVWSSLDNLDKHARLHVPQGTASTEFPFVRGQALLQHLMQQRPGNAATAIAESSAGLCDAIRGPLPDIEQFLCSCSGGSRRGRVNAARAVPDRTAYSIQVRAMGCHTRRCGLRRQCTST